MEINEFENKILQKLEAYEGIYDEYKRTLEKTLLLMEQLRMRFNNRH